MCYLIDLDHHAVDRECDVAAVDAHGAVLAHEVVERYLHQRGHGLSQKAWKAEAEYAPGDAERGPEVTAAYFYGAHVSEIHETHAAGGTLADGRRYAGADDAHLEYEDEYRVQDEVYNCAKYHALHRVLRRAVCTDYSCEGRTHELKRYAPGHRAQIGNGLVVGRIRGSAEHDQPRRKDAAAEGAYQTAADYQSQRMRRRGVRILLLAAAQTKAHVGRAAIAQQKGNRVHENHQREGHVRGGHAGYAHALADKYLVNDIVEVVDHQSQRRRHRVFEQQPEYRLGLERVCGFCSLLHTASPSGSPRRRA